MFRLLSLDVASFSRIAHSHSALSESHSRNTHTDQRPGQKTSSLISDDQAKVWLTLNSPLYFNSVLAHFNLSDSGFSCIPPHKSKVYSQRLIHTDFIKSNFLKKSYCFFYVPSGSWTQLWSAVWRRWRRGWRSTWTAAWMLWSRSWRRPCWALCRWSPLTTEPWAAQHEEQQIPDRRSRSPRRQPCIESRSTKKTNIEPRKP